jgi:hypothetical protein
VAFYARDTFLKTSLNSRKFSNTYVILAEILGFALFKI